MICQACGSNKAKLKVFKNCKIKKMYFTVTYTERIVSCPVCCAQIDVTNDKLLGKLILEAKKKAIPEMIKKAEKEGNSLANIHRVFGMPQRTLLKKDNSEEFISLVFAFLKIVLNTSVVSDFDDTEMY